MTGPAVIAHRGASAHAPENTLAAFVLAAQRGAAFIETDLRRTHEGHFVLLHDSHVNRTTNGRGRVEQLELGAVRQFDAGSWFGKEFAGERIPTLEEGLTLAESLGLGTYLEMKIPLSVPLISALVNQVRRFRLDRVVLLSFRPEILRTVHALEPRLGTGLLVRRNTPAVELARQTGARLLAPHRKRVSSRLVAKAHRAGLGVVTWTVNGRREMRKMLAMGVDGIMTNRPDRLVEVLIESGTAPGPSMPEALSPAGKNR